MASFVLHRSNVHYRPLTTRLIFLAATAFAAFLPASRADDGLIAASLITSSSTPVPQSETDAIQHLKDRLKSLNDRATVHLETGGYSRARDLYRERLRIESRIYGDAHDVKTLSLLCTELDRICGLDAKAQATLRQAQCAEKEGSRCLQSNDLVAAIRAHRESLELYRKVLGDRSFLALYAAPGLINSLSLANRTKELRECLSEQVSFSQAILGEQHVSTGRELRVSATWRPNSGCTSRLRHI